MEKGRGRRKKVRPGRINSLAESPDSVDHPLLLEASLLWLLSPPGFSAASLELLTLPIHWDAELKDDVAIHRIKEKSGREADYYNR